MSWKKRRIGRENPRVAREREIDPVAHQLAVVIHGMRRIAVALIALLVTPPRAQSANPTRRAAGAVAVESLRQEVAERAAVEPAVDVAERRQLRTREAMAEITPPFLVDSDHRIARPARQ